MGRSCSLVIHFKISRAEILTPQTAEHLTLASLGKSALQQRTEEAGDRTNSQFKEDPSIPAMFRAKLQDYFRSGYDRGHMYVLVLAAASVCAIHLQYATGCLRQTRSPHRRVFFLRINAL